MESKIRVYGKAQNRTALGIMNAYMVMNPKATMEELQQAFPDSLNPDSGVKKNFVKENDPGTTANWEGFMRNEEDLLKMGDGSRVAVVKMWTKPSFDRLVEHAKQYGIEVAKFEAADKGFGAKGGFRLEYLNGYVPPQLELDKPKSSKKWLWIILAIIVIAAIAVALYINSQS